jgi:putative addiction module component (TIGR02574 family)
MSNEAEAIFNAAMKLTDEERVDLANRILCSVDSHFDMTPTPEEAAEIERRIDDFKAGRAKLIPADEAFNSILKKLGKD